MAVSDRESAARHPDALPPTAEAPSSGAGSARVLGRLLESFFARPVVCLVPLLLFTALGLAAMRGAERTFESTGVVSVSDQTLLADLTNLRGGDGFGWETPAAVTARRINELLGTDDFASTVAVGAGLEPLLLDGSLTLDDVRESIGASSAGANLVRLSATSAIPAHALATVESTFDSFVQWLIEGDVGESAAAEEFFSVLIDRYEQEVVEARSTLEEYLAAHPSSPTLRPAPERAEIDRLTTGLELAQDRYGAAIAGAQEAQLATEQSVTDVGQRLRLVDAPQLPVVPESGRKDLAITAVLYVAIGVLFSSALIAAGALLDRSLRTAHDVHRSLGLPVVAVIPDADPRVGRT